jgi:hypothetical protein
MRRKRPHVATPDEVRLTRHGDAAIIEYADERVGTIRFTLGSALQQMTDQEILDRWNECLLAQARIAAQYGARRDRDPAREAADQVFRAGLPVGAPRDVLRCVIDDGGPDGEPVIHIDDHELCWKEFGRLLVTHAGWGMRIVFVPDDEVHEAPRIEVREPQER